MAGGTELADRCGQVAALAREALDWVTDDRNAGTVGPDRKSLVQRLTRAARRADKLGRAARTRMSVSVFGPSQAGKSFLVSVLARPPGGRLVSDFPDPAGRLDFIKEINPEGEGESTGLVTRFTAHGYAAPPGFPVKLRLLSEADIARILINSFFWDGDKSEPEPGPEDLGAHLARFRGQAGAPVAGLTTDDVVDIQDYVGRLAARSTYAAALASFWEDAADLAPRLDVADRAALLAVCWGGHAAFTALYVRLAGALAALGHADEAFAGLDALVPREDSIIDVKLLAGLDRDDGPALTVTAAGRRAVLPKAVVAALTAELVLPMAERPHDLFADTDLLDFPGARTRDERPLAAFLAGGSGPLKDCVLRGKVAYLFDRYVADQEITAMLLCIPDSNVETGGLSALVADWVAATHGATPDRRADVDTLLFFVLTKFDKHLIDSAGSGDDPMSRFDKRMRMSLLEKFGAMPDSWPRAWAPGRPFDNCYWLRNPNFPADAVITYDAGREVAIRPDKVARLAEMRAGCCAAEPVRTHFRDPGTAWDAAMALNDGGVDHLMRGLAPVCRPDSKRAQIRAQIARVAGDLVIALDGHHLSDDLHQRLEDKRRAAGQVIDALYLALEGHRFGAVMSHLMVDQDAVHDRIVRVPPSVRLTASVAPAAASAGRRVVAPAVASVTAGRSAPVPAPGGTGGPRIRTMTAETFQAETAVEVWIEGLTRFEDDVARLARFGFTPATANALAGELVHGLRRTGVIDRTTALLRAISFGHTVDKQALPASIVCAEAINGFVATLGYDRVPVQDRPVVALPEGGTRPVFAAHVPSDTAADLPADPRGIAERHWTDWAHALLALFEANAQDGAAGRIDIEQNAQLGRILTGLRGTGTGAA
ncbi:MAG: putative virulence factor [Rhodobacteraceae bacterium]|jgi:hypothetical protein|nr:putative virulence factor [Paracoccaceae bacterium]